MNLSTYIDRTPEPISVEQRPTGLSLQDTISVAIAQAAAPVISLISLRMLTQRLLPSEYGTIAIVMSYVLAALSVVLVPMSGPGTILFHEWVKKERSREFLGTLLTIYTALALLLAIPLALLALLRRSGNPQLVSPALLCGGILLCAEMIKGPVITLANMASLRRQYALLSLLDASGKLLLALLIIHAAGPVSASVLIAYAVNSLLVAFAGWNIMFRSDQGSASSAQSSFVSPMLLRSLLTSSAPFCGIGIANWVLSVSDRALIGSLVSPHAAGVYTASYQAASIVPMALYSFFGALIWPIIYRRHVWAPIETASLIGNSVGYLLWLIVPFTLTAILGKNMLLEAFVGQGYDSGSPFMMWVSCAFALLGLTSITAMPFWLKERSVTFLKITAGAAFCNIIFNLVFIPKVGIKAAAVSTFVAYLILFIASVVAGRQALPWRMPAIHLYATVLGTIGAMTAFLVAEATATLMRLSLFLLSYFAASIPLLCLMDAIWRSAVSRMLARTRIWRAAS